MGNRFGSASVLGAPAYDAFAIAPSDGADLNEAVQAIYVGTGGNITLTTAAGNDVLFSSVPAGTVLPIRTVRVKATGTTASNLVGLA